jgi:hypothetical protein
VSEWLAASPLWLRILVPALAVGTLVTWIGVPAVVRYAVVQRCEERQLVCEVGEVRFGFGRLWLRDIAVSDSVLPNARAHVDSVQIRPVFWGAGVRVFGGRVELNATDEALRQRARQLTSSDATQGAETSTRSAGRPIEVQGVDLAISDPASGRRANLWGLRARRTEAGWFLAVDAVASKLRGVSARVRALEVSLVSTGGARRIERIEAASAAVHLELPSRGDAPDARPSSGLSKTKTRKSAKAPADGRNRKGAAHRSSADATGVQSALSRGESSGGEVPSTAGSAASAASAASASSASNAGAAAASNAGAVSGSGVDANSRSLLPLVALRPVLAEVTSSNFRAAVVALTIEAQGAEESLRFGPSRFVVQRAPDAFSFELVPLPQGGRAEATPLSMRVRLPLGEARPELDLTGGPVSLSALGVREGDLGLVGVRDARLEASLHATLGAVGGHAADGAGYGAVEVSSQGLLENVRLRRAALAPNELSGIRLGWHFEGKVSDHQEVTLKHAELSLGDVRLRLAGDVARTAERTLVRLQAEMPQAACGAVLAAVPHGMAPLLEPLRVEGTLALKAKIDFDSAHVDDTRINLDVNNQCRISNVPPAISPNRFRDAWWREVKGADGLPMTIQSGPGSPDWTPYEEISPFLETAILVCEDAGFFAHRGIDYRAIENSIRMNLEAGRFLRGGSTVTMQLAKNLYLSKEKTLSRKFQEAVFTQLLEQELSKHELMELYLNVIEFGPGIYGVRQAARYYFNEEPRDLSLGQALYLASILPAPDTQHFAADGRVKDGWASYLRKLMHIARKIRRISDEELQAGLAEQVAFRKPSEHVTPFNGSDEADDASGDDASDDDEKPPTLLEQ